MPSAIDWEILGIVRKILRSCPVYKCVARIASLSEPGCRMTWIGGVVPVRRVAGVASRTVQVVVVSHMALTAPVIGQHGRVIAGQCERRGRMSKRRARPGRSGGVGRVAQRAVLRETGRRMGRVGGAVVLGRVAVIAERGFYVVTGRGGVARVARLRRMRARQSEASGSVIKGRPRPIHKGVAPGAVMREALGRMRRIHSAGVVVLMTAPAVARRRRVGGCACMTSNALVGGQHVGVVARQSQRAGRMSKCRACPRWSGQIGGVAGIARRREPGLGVVRRRRSVVIAHVAVGARPAGDVVIAEGGGVALVALQTGVRSRQRETCRRVIERRPAPAGHRRVATIASRGEVRCHVGRIHGAVVIAHVAVRARPVGDGVTAKGGGVTLRALHSCVRSRQRETCRRMVESRPTPAGYRRVTTIARRWK